MHLFQHPGHAEDESVCLERFPRTAQATGSMRLGRDRPGLGLKFRRGLGLQEDVDRGVCDFCARECAVGGFVDGV
jgi:hypothetical protein